MPRPHRIEYPGAWYLIENRGYDGNNIFDESDDYLCFFSLLEDISKIFSIEVHAYCLLEDRYYLLVHTPQAELSRAMRHLNGVYTQKFNQVWESDGPVFQGRYKAIVIDPVKYLIDVANYIHSQPIVANYSQKAAEYPWSSLCAYLKASEKPTWLHTEKVLRPLGFIKTFALAKLNKFAQKGITEEFKELLKKERVILGDQNFKKEVKELSQNQNKISRSKESKTKQNITAKEILDFVSFAYKIPVSDIKKSQSGIQNEARNMAVYQLRTVAGLPQKQIAKILNSANGYTVAKTLQRFNQKMDTDQELHQTATELTKNIQSQLKN